MPASGTLSGLVGEEPASTPAPESPASPDPPVQIPVEPEPQPPVEPESSAAVEPSDTTQSTPDDPQPAGDDVSHKAGLDDLREAIREMGGGDVTYDSARKILQAFVHQRQLIGQRDEGAQAWKVLVDRLGEQGALALLQQQPETADGQPSGLPSYQDFEELQARAATDPAAEAQLTRIRGQMVREMYDLTRRSSELKAVLDRVRQGGFVTVEEAQRRQETAQQYTWVQQHASDLYPGGQLPTDREPTRGDLTPLGQKAYDYVAKGMKWPDALMEAKQFFAAQEAAKPKPTGTRSTTARAQPSVPVAPPASSTVDIHQLAKQLDDAQGHHDNLLGQLVALSNTDTK